MIDLAKAEKEWGTTEPLSKMWAGTYVHDYSSHYGTNAIEVRIGHLKLYFSYGKIVAFRYDNAKPVVMRNVFSMTTGKHLNAIDGGDYESRLSTDEFAVELSSALYLGG